MKRDELPSHETRSSTRLRRRMEGERKIEGERTIEGGTGAAAGDRVSRSHRNGFLPVNFDEFRLNFEIADRNFSRACKFDGRHDFSALFCSFTM